MTPLEKQAYEWALNQKYESVSARYARTLAGVIERELAALQAENDRLKLQIKARDILLMKMGIDPARIKVEE